MKKIVFLLSIVLLLGSCKNEVMSKPDKLIDEDKMVEIIYDLAVLEAMRSQHKPGQPDLVINPKQYIYKKYQIDSVQFAQSNHYYASDMNNYKKMYDKVSHRIETEQKQADVLSQKGQGKSAPSKSVEEEPQIK